jgi:hypothetical protein
MSYKPSLAMTQASRLLILPMSVLFLAFNMLYAQATYSTQVYSNGLAEVILGKAIKQLNLPRDEIVVMTKVCVPPCVASSHLNIASQLYAVVGRETGVNSIAIGKDPDSMGYVNQHGLSRKVNK